MNRKLFFSFIFISVFAAIEPVEIIAQEKQSIYTLDTLLDATKHNHPELLKLQEEYRRSLLDVKDAWWNLGPTVDFQASGTYMVNPPVGAMYINTDDIINSIRIDGQRPQSRGQRIKVFDGMESTLYNFQVDVTQPVFTWGKITNAIKLYRQISQIKQTQITQQTEQLETELKTRLLSLFYMNRILAILDEEQSYADRMVQVSESAEQTGMLLHQEVVDAKIQAKELEIAKQDLLEQINDQLLELGRITGIEAITADKIDFSFVDQVVESFDKLLQTDSVEIENQVLSGNQSSIKMLTQLENVSKTAEKISRGAENWKPDFALQMSSSYSGSRVPLVEPNWLRKDDYSVNISVGLKTTIWDGGKKVRDVSRKVSEVETAELNKLDARSELSKTFNSQWNAAQVCTMKIEYLDGNLCRVEVVVS